MGTTDESGRVQSLNIKPPVALEIHPFSTSMIMGGRVNRLYIDPMDVIFVGVKN